MKNANDFMTEICNIEQNAKIYILSMFDDKNVDELVLSSPYRFCYFNENNVPISELVECIRVNVYSENDIVFTTTLDNDVVDSMLVDSGALPLFAKIVENEFERRDIAIKEQNELVNSPDTPSTQKFAFLPDKYNPCDLTADQFVGRAFMHGEVMTAEEYADRFNLYQLGDIHPDKGTLRVVEIYDTCVEMCPHCEYEVVLETKFCKQRCPICGRLIKPCNLCADCISPCPLGEDN